MRRVRIAILVIGILAVLAVVQMAKRGPAVEDGTALTVSLQGAYVEAPDPGVLAHLAGLLVPPPPSFPSLISELAKAERDARIDTVVFRVRRLGMRWGKAQELRRAIARLREAGKDTVAYLEVQTYGANLEYYLATACDEIVLAPGVPAPLSGLRAEYLFLGGFWERLGVELDVLGVGEYKGAVETLGARGMSRANREMADSLLDSVEQQLLSAVSEARGLDFGRVRAAIDAAPMSPVGAMERKLVDRIAHWDEVFQARDEPPRIALERYAAVPAASVGFEPVASFALIFGAGNVVQGEATGSRPVFASDTVVEALDGAADDADIQAIVLRLDSPGGSGAAAEQIWRAVRRARTRKPVIASMSDLAASAAYYVAAAADRIVSHPGTYTGSIGVFVVRPSFGSLLDKLEIGHETLLRGEHADLLAMLQPLSDATRDRFRSDIEASYVQFVERVAEGRGLPLDAVDEVARGRVWTGEQARERGLVDELGGLREAVLAGKRAAGLAADADVELRVYPAPRSFSQQLREVAGAARTVRGAALASLTIPAPVATAAAWLAELPAGAQAWLPPIAIEIR
jgi:protease-4